MLTLVTTLVDRLIELFKERRESDRKLYEDFVVPAMGDLEKLHQNYLETFKSYRAEIASDAAPLTPEHPIFDRLNADSLYSAQLRAKIHSLSEFSNDTVFGPLMEKIVFYARGNDASHQVLLAGQRRIPNAPRSRAFAGLTDIAANDDPRSRKKEQALALLDRIIDEQQWHYSEAIKASTELRNTLLNKRIG